MVRLRRNPPRSRGGGSQSRLPGRKILVSGNHDACHPMRSKGAAMVTRYAAAFDVVVSAATIKMAGQRVLASHFPYTGDSGDHDDRHVEWRLPDTGATLLHGHVHSTDVLTYSGAGTAQVHVGWDAWGQPVPYGQVEKVVQQA